MNRFEPKLREFLEIVFGQGQQPELVRDSDWSYEYRSGEKGYACISKFFLDETYAISASEFRSRWPKMGEGERLDFASNFWIKKNWTVNDTEILEVIMQDGNDRLWESCAQAFLKDADRDRAVSFLLGRLEDFEGGEPLNYIQALGLTRDRRATSAIKRFYEKYRGGVEAESVSGIPQDVVFGPIPYHAYFCACEALLRIEGSAEYEAAIRKYLDHPHKQVRRWANHALGIEEPPV
ncbi:MAG TPA: hypothetical protein VKV95_22245 [Terriglobia bacterium]|nr:hypothetical protein [Terriglobia bacterium]